MHPVPTPPIQIITTTEALSDWCAKVLPSDLLCVDTEFMRERTYYPQLSLIQLATESDATIVDPLSKELDLTPLFNLLARADVMKVFHAARQDLEIFYLRMNQTLPNLFDTQVAAMVCGYGESCSYGRLVQAICKKQIEKGQQFTDWNRRPLEDAQLSYALSDVTYLPAITHHLRERLRELGREEWIAEEMAELREPSTFAPAPEDAWKKIKLRSRKPLFVALVQRIAAWREEEARRRDHPRQWILKDDAISEIAAMRPKDVEDLRALRGTRSTMSEATSRKILKIMEAVYDLPAEELPRLPEPPQRPQIPTAVADLLRILLKDCADKAEVAPRLIAAAHELDDLATGLRDGLPCLTGWRYELFGQHALLLADGKLALTPVGNGLRYIPLSES